MFDLFRSRDKMVKILLSVLLGVVALSMVTYLVPNFTDPTFVSTDPVLAEVGGERITALQAQQLFQANAQGQLPPEMMEIYFPQYVDQMIQQRAAVYEARRRGLRVTDEEVLVALQASSLGSYFQNGKVISMEQFTLALAQNGMTPQMVIDDMRNQLLLRKLQNVITESAVITPQEIEQAFRDKYERVTVQYLDFSAAEFRSQVQITDQEVRDRYEAQKALYTEPEKYNFKVAVLDQYNLESSVSLTEGELRTAYSSSMDNFRQPEKVQARHILVDSSSRSVSEARTKAQDLLAQIRGGADFAEVAAANSDDPGSAVNGGDLGEFTRGQMVPEFDEAAFSLPEGQVSDLVQSTYGFHIIEVTDKVPSTVLPFESVRSDIESELRSQRVSETVARESEALRSELAREPENAAAIAARHGADLVTVTGNAPGDPIPTLGVSPEIDGVLPLLQPGQASELLSLPAGRLVVAILDEKIPGRQSEFDEVEAQVRDSIITSKADTVAAERAETAADRLMAGENIDAVARSMGLEVQSPSTFARADNIDGLGPAGYLSAAFTAETGAVIGPEFVQGRNIVAVVTDKTEPDLSQLDSERASLLLTLKQDKARLRNDLFLDSVLNKLTAEGKVTVNHDEIQRTTQLYRQ